MNENREYSRFRQHPTQITKAFALQRLFYLKHKGSNADEAELVGMLTNLNREDE